MADPDMVFTERELAAADRAAGRRHPYGPAPTGPDMVFTESELAAASRPTAPSTTTAEERDRSRPPAGPSAERAAALASSGDSRRSEAIGALGGANDAAAAVGAYRGTGEIMAAGTRGPFMPRTPVPGGGLDLRPLQIRSAAPVSDVALGGLGTAAGLAQMYGSYRSGTREGATDADRRQAAYGVGVGAAGASSGIMTMAGSSPAASVFGVVGGGLEVAQGVDNIRHGDVAAEGAGYQQVLHGGLAAGAGAATLAGATTVAAPVLTAAAAGVSVGTAMQQRADAVSLEEGRYTETRYGRGLDGASGEHNITATNAAEQGGRADGAVWTELTGSENVGFVMGGLSTVGRSIYNTFTNLW